MQSTTQTKKKTTPVAVEEPLQKNSFLGKLFSILSNASLAQVISWADEGDRFQIFDNDRLQNEVIPAYFKHKNLKSFIRQLNLHGFKKLRGRAKAKEQSQDMYKHNFFRRDQPDLISFIKRKVSKPVETDEKTEQINSLIEKQKELQEKVRKISEAKSSDVYKVLAQNADNEPTKLFLEALKIFADGPGSQEVPQSRATIYSLTKAFLGNLSSLKLDKALSEDCTAASLNLESEDLCFLAKRDPNGAWEEASDSDYEEIPVSPRKSLHSGNSTPSFTESEEDFDHIIQCHMNPKIGLSKKKQGPVITTKLE